MRNKKLHALVARSTFAVKKLKSPHLWNPFGSRDVETVHAVVARSTFPSQNVQTKPFSDQFLEIDMSKKCTPLWREANFQVKMYKAPQPGSAFGSLDVEKVHAVVAQSTFRSQNVQSKPFSDHFWKLTCRKSACRCGVKHISKSKCRKHISLGALLGVEMSKKVRGVVA